MQPNCQSKENGFVLIVVLVLMMFFAVVAQRFSRQILINQAYSRSNTRKEQAKLLALSGIGIALCQMYKAEHLDSGKNPTETEKLQKLYAYILPKHHLWQEYRLESKTDGINGNIYFSISSEDGKIDINQVYDPEKKALSENLKPILDKFSISKNEKEQKLSQYLLEFFKKRKNKKIEDPTQLELGEWFKTFYCPPPLPNEKKDGFVDKKTAISDLFTVFGSKTGLNPMLLSTSIRKVLGFSKPEYKDETNKKDIFKKVCSKISENYGSNWQSNFKEIEPIYLSKENDLQENSVDITSSQEKNDEDGDLEEKKEKQTKKSSKGLGEIENLLSKEIEPKFFSVLSCGKYKEVRQCILAIVEREKLKDIDEKSWNQRENFIVPPGYKIIRIYYGIDLI